MNVKMHLRLAEVLGRPCRVESCRRTRKGLSNYCGTCLKAHRRYGSPLGRKIPKEHYRAEVAEVRELFKTFPDHPGVKAALDWLQGLIDVANSGDTTIPAYRHLQRVSRAGFTAKDIVIETSALWLYAHRHSALFKADEVLTFALAIAVLYLCPREYVKSWHYRSGERRHYRTPTRQEREELGRALRLKLSPLYVAIVQGVERQSQAAKDAQASLSVPFTAQR